MESNCLAELICTALEDTKAVDLTVLDVSPLTAITSSMIICTATSHRHARALMKNLLASLKDNHVQPLGIEGEQAGEWILVDLIDVVVHIMIRDVRDFYKVEELWAISGSFQQKEAAS